MRLIVLVAAIVAAPLFGQQASSDPSRPIVVDLSAAVSDATGGTWRSYDTVVTWTRPAGNVYLFVNRSDRPSGSGTFAAAGILHDWSPRIFTYVAAGAGTGDAPYVPRFRGDAEVNFKLLASRALVASAGFTTVRYEESRRDDVIGAGLTWYGPVALTWRYFHNDSHPGSIGSHSQLVQASFERRGSRAAWVRHSWGNEAYLPLAIVSPDAVRTSGRTTTAAYRQWISERGGFTAEVERQTKGGSFARTGFRLGLFLQF